MEPYNYFGESTLFHKTIRTATITADSDVSSCYIFNLTGYVVSHDNGQYYGQCWDQILVNSLLKPALMDI